jgi:hypothetical protein
MLLGFDDLYNAHGHKLRLPTFEKAQFVTALGIVLETRGCLFGFELCAHGFPAESA